MGVTERFKKLNPAKRERITAAAVEEFARYGFVEASMNRLVRRVGIAKGSLFQYFGNKEGLFRFVFEHAVDLVRGSLRQVKQETADADFFTRIRRSLLAGVRFIDEHPLIYQIYLKMVFQERFPYREQFVRQVHLFSAEYLTPLLEAGIERGELRADLDVATTVFMLDALLDRFLQAYCVSFLDAGSGIYRASPEDLDERIERLIHLLKHGLAGEESLVTACGAAEAVADDSGTERRR